MHIQNRVYLCGNIKYVCCVDVHHHHRYCSKYNKRSNGQLQQRTMFNVNEKFNFLVNGWLNCRSHTKWWLFVLIIGCTNGTFGARLIGSDDNTIRDLGCPTNCSCLGDYLDCIKLNLRSVPEIPDWICSLELSHNKLDDNVDKSIANLSKLIDLKLNKNRIENFPIFMGLTSLSTLQLANNKIKVIPQEALLALPQLTSLDLSRNLIKNILSNTFPSNNILQHLNLKNNHIEYLDKNAFIHLKYVIDLKLNQNQLELLPSRLFINMNMLKRMDISCNHISHISWLTFANLTELRVLKLRNNNIQNLTTGVFHGLNNLLILELDNNYLTSLSKDGLYNLTTLNTISLSNNSIRKIEQNTWEFCPMLVNIDLSMNNLTTIDETTYDCLTKLKELNMNNNQIDLITDGSFNCTVNLEFLDLSNNRISWTVEDSDSRFGRLKKLDRFQLSRNRIQSINQNTFAGMNSLTYLDLTQNNITSIQQGAFTKTPVLRDLMINTTSLVCDCTVIWLYKLLSTKRYNQVNVACGYPMHLRGKFLHELEEEHLACNKTPNPRIIDEPHQLLGIIGTNQTLECSASSSSEMKIQFKWKRDNTELNDLLVENHQSKNPLTNDTIAQSTLNLLNINLEHAGKYQCVASNNYGTAYSQKAKVTVASMPRFKKIPKDLTLNSSNTARLDCAAIGDPNPQIAWQKDGGNDFPAARERRMHVMPADDAFFIINAKMSDQGVYTCTAENPAGVIKANVTLTVYEPPSFVKPMENKAVTTGKSSVLECMASGSPKPNLCWYKDGESIEATERHFFAAEDQLLIIVDTTMSDAGTYKCEMKNILGIKSGAMQLKVSPAAESNFINVDEMTGIVIITVVCCAVGTSIIWVVIIYQTKKGNGCTSYLPPPQSPPSHENTTREDLEFRDLTIHIMDSNKNLVNATTENDSLLVSPLRDGLQTTELNGHFAHKIDEEDDEDSNDNDDDDEEEQDSGNGDSGKHSMHPINHNETDCKSETTISIQSSVEDECPNANINILTNKLSDYLNSRERHT